MTQVGLVERRVNRIIDLTPAWHALWSAILEAKDNSLQPSLCRFVHFLSRQTIEPNAVRDVHAHAYREALELNEISKSPEVAYRAAVLGWNRAVRRVPQWPPNRLSLASRKLVYRLPLTTFPANFVRDLDTRMADLGSPDPLSDARHTKALSQITISHYRSNLIRFASELVHSGVPPEQITSISAIVDPIMAERGLRQMLSRNGNRSSWMIGDMASLLRTVGLVIGISLDAEEQLTKLARRLAMKKQVGITPKNRARLRVLQDGVHQRRLLFLPEHIFARSQRKAKNFTVSLAREDALAIAILLVCPVRIKNLAGILINKHLHRPGDGRVFLVFEESEVKNERPMEFELPRDVVRMMERHLATRSPELCPAGTPWLFPRRDGLGAVDTCQLASRISTRIRREIGLEMNAHLFRHFAVMNWLDANPGGYEVARRLLGHSRLSETINRYSGLEVTSATKAFADLIELKKGRRN